MARCASSRWMWCLVLLWAVLALGCSDDAPKNDDGLKGKTPVVRPEDVHGGGSRGAVTLAPDYRQGLTADLDPELEAARRGKAGSRPAGTAKRVETPAPAGPAKEQPPQATSRQENPKPSPQAPAAASQPPSPDSPLRRCRQLVLVVAPDIGAARGTLRRFERAKPDDAWREVGAAAPCVLGRKGLAVGRGLVGGFDGPARRQGDGRTPLGLFALTEAFGYAAPDAARDAGVRLPYTYVTDRMACVTDPASRLYGRVVGPEERQSAGVTRQERMVRTDNANSWGVVIGHNRDNPEAEAGTCLFLNVRPDGGSSTGGSIGCPKDVTAAVAAWLDPAAEPLLAVLPEKLYRERKAAWGLP